LHCALFLGKSSITLRHHTFSANLNHWILKKSWSNLNSAISTSGLGSKSDNLVLNLDFFRFSIIVQFLFYFFNLICWFLPMCAWFHRDSYFLAQSKTTNLNTKTHNTIQALSFATFPAASFFNTKSHPSICYQHLLLRFEQLRPFIIDENLKPFWIQRLFAQIIHGLA